MKNMQGQVGDNRTEYKELIESLKKHKLNVIFCSDVLFPAFPI